MPLSIGAFRFTGLVRRPLDWFRSANGQFGFVLPKSIVVARPPHPRLRQRLREREDKRLH
jgi:hypothetical protein